MAALEMVNGIKKEFELILNEVNWMDEETRQSALNKLRAMSTHIGYPDEIMDNSKIQKYYETLEIDENNYLSSVLNMNVFGTDYAFNKLRQPVNKTDWRTHARPAVVNAFYSSIENSIRKTISNLLYILHFQIKIISIIILYSSTEFPAGILQGKFFSADSKYNTASSMCNIVIFWMID